MRVSIAIRLAFRVGALSRRGSGLRPEAKARNGAEASNFNYMEVDAMSRGLAMLFASRFVRISGIHPVYILSIDSLHDGYALIGGDETPRRVRRRRTKNDPLSRHGDESSRFSAECRNCVMLRAHQSSLSAADLWGFADTRAEACSVAV